MKKNRYKEIDETSYEVFQYFKEQCREQRYGEITVTVTMHDGYPVKIDKRRMAGVMYKGTNPLLQG